MIIARSEGLIHGVTVSIVDRATFEVAIRDMKNEQTVEVNRYHTLHQAMVVYGNKAGSLLADETAYLSQNPSVSDETEMACFSAMETNGASQDASSRHGVMQ